MGFCHSQAARKIYHEKDFLGQFSVFCFFVFLFLRCSRFQLKSSACLKVTFLFSPLLNQTPNSKANLS